VLPKLCDAVMWVLYLHFPDGEVEVKEWAQSHKALELNLDSGLSDTTVHVPYYIVAMWHFI
jgi:hypothetical protein